MIRLQAGKFGRKRALTRWHGWIEACQILGILLLGVSVAACVSRGGTAGQQPVEVAYQALASSSFAPIGDRKSLKAYRRGSDELRRALDQQRLSFRCQEGDQWSCQRLRSDAGIEGEDPPLDRVEVVGSRIAGVAPANVITNNQEAGVDEGDIVKKSGRFLFVLRHGWLHVFNTGTPAAPALEQIQSLQVATDPSGETVWYDEILTFDNRLVLLGFNYAADVAELITYAIDGSGHLQRDARYWIRVQDYYSASNYGARVEGDNLLLILAMPLDVSGEDAWPMWSRRDGGPSVWQPLVELDHVHLPVAVPIQPIIHLVVRCPLRQLGGNALECRTTGVVGEARSSSYVSSQAVYLAVEYWPAHVLLDPLRDLRYWPDSQKEPGSTIIYRFPFAAGAATTFALFQGLPGNQFTFVEREARFYAAMAAPAADFKVESVLLLQSISTEAFGSDVDAPARAHLDVRRPLHPDQLTFRFTDHGLLIGSYSDALDGHRGSPETAKANKSRATRVPPILVQPLDGSDAVAIGMGHSADQIEPVHGGIAVSGLDRAARWQVSILVPAAGGLMPFTVAVPEWRPSESRSHAFNHVQWADGSVLLGWPVTPWDIGVSPLHEDWYWRQLTRVSDLALLRWDGRRLEKAGILDMHPETAPPKCADPWDCMDWYGNARLFFYDGRIFALSGPRLVEAAWDGQVLRPLRSLTMP